MLHTHTFIYSSIHDCHNLILAMTQINTLNFVTTLYTKRYAADTQNTYFNKLPYQTAWFTTSVCCTHDTHYILAFLQGTDSHLLYMTLWSATHNIHLIRAEIKSQPKALCPPPPPGMRIHNAIWQGQTLSIRLRWDSHSVWSWEETMSNNSISLPLCVSHPPFFALLNFSSSFHQFLAISSLKVCVCPFSRPCTQFLTLLLSHSPYSLYPEDRGSRYLSNTLKDPSLKVIMTTEFCWNMTLLLATKVLPFQRITEPSCSGWSRPFSLYCLTWKTRHYNPLQWWELLANNMTSHPRRLVSSAALQSCTACWFPSVQTVTWGIRPYTSAPNVPGSHQSPAHSFSSASYKNVTDST